MVTAAFATSANGAVYRLAASYGTFGEGEGQFMYPEGIDTDSTGNVWVASGIDGRVIELSPEGTWIKQLTGTNKHTFKRTSDVAVAPDGNIWVADRYSETQYVLEEINTKGEYLRQVTPTECGCEWRPNHVVVDSKGNVWARGDRTHPDRLYKFNSEGVFQKYITNENIENGFTLDNSDNLWISDFSGKELEGYDSSGSPIGAWGVFPAGPTESTVDAEGNFWIMEGYDIDGYTAKEHSFISKFHEENDPCCLAPAPNGQLWLAAWTNGGQIQRWWAAPIATAEAATSISESQATLNGSVNPSGLETTYQFEYGTSPAYGKVAPASPKSAGAGTTSQKKSETVSGLEANTIYHYRLKASNAQGTVYGEDKVFISGTNEWGLESTAEPAGSTSAEFNSVSCTSSSSCAAVGSYTNGAGTVVTLGKVKSGGVWSLTTTPNPAGWSILTDVSCTASNACTAVGYGGTSGTTLAERWNGSTWTIQSTPNVAGATNVLTGVSCTASNSCDAVGYSSAAGATSALAEHWNGASWSIISIPNAPGYTKSYLKDIACVSSSDCWAVGSATSKAVTEASLAEHWNGTKWTVTSPASSESLKNISCGSASMCVATTDKNAIFRWNGSTWTQEATPMPAGSTVAAPSGVSCTSASACTAVGLQVQGTTNIRTLAESWNGSKWSIQTTSEPAGTVQESKLDSVSCVSATSCTTVGNAKVKSAVRMTLVETRP